MTTKIILPNLVNITKCKTISNVKSPEGFELKTDIFTPHNLVESKGLFGVLLMAGYKFVQENKAKKTLYDFIVSEIEDSLKKGSLEDDITLDVTEDGELEDGILIDQVVCYALFVYQSHFDKFVESIKKMQKSKALED